MEYLQLDISVRDPLSGRVLVSETHQVTFKFQPTGIDIRKDLIVEELAIGVRPFNCLVRANIRTVGAILRTGRRKILTLPNFGEKSLAELEAALAELDIELPD